MLGKPYYVLFWGNPIIYYVGETLLSARLGKPYYLLCWVNPIIYYVGETLLFAVLGNPYYLRYWGNPIICYVGETLLFAILGLMLRNLVGFPKNEGYFLGGPFIIWIRVFELLYWGNLIKSIILPF